MLDYLSEYGFQFHKVRLKDIILDCISDGNKFQFHKVRLKVGNILTILIMLHRFNSIRYD